jgi:hypothetical protein
MFQRTRKWASVWFVMWLADGESIAGSMHTTTVAITVPFCLSRAPLAPSLSVSRAGNSVCPLSFVSRHWEVPRRDRYVWAPGFIHLLAPFLTSARDCWVVIIIIIIILIKIIIIIWGRWLLVIYYDVMRADDVSVEYLQLHLKRLSQFGPQFKRRLEEYLQIAGEEDLTGRSAISLRYCHPN